MESITITIISARVDKQAQDKQREGATYNLPEHVDFGHVAAQLCLEAEDHGCAHDVDKPETQCCYHLITVCCRFVSYSWPYHSLIHHLFISHLLRHMR